MSKTEFVLEAVKLILEAVRDLKKFTASAEKVCTFVAEGLADEKPAAVKTEAKKPSVTLEKVRGVLAEKSQAGYTTEVRAIIAKHGASRLSDLAPEKYEEVLKDAEVLGNAG